MSFFNRPTYSRAERDHSKTEASRSAEEQSKLGSIVDPYLANSWHQSSLAKFGPIQMGRIVYVHPYANSYKVLVEHFGELLCCKLSNDAGQMAPGVRETGPLTVGDCILVFIHPRMPYAFILGTIPEIVQSGALVYPDHISQGGNSGFHRERYYHELLSVLSAEGGIKDFSCSTPIDTTILDWGRVSTLGGMLHIDPFMMSFRMDETCGLQLFYHDSMARLSGYNLELRSAFHDQQFLNDEGESSYYYGETMYPWEALGGLEVTTPIYRDVEAKDALFDKPYSTLEPMYDDQQPFHRYREWGGYLGQGRIRELQVPPEDSRILRASEGKDAGMIPVGLFREHIHPDGEYTLQSVSGITIAKRAYIPMAKRMREAADPKGDNPENYKAAGQFGDGDEHVIGQLDVEAGDLPAAMTRVTGIEQAEAYNFNKRDVHGFDVHKEDFEVAEEEDQPQYNEWTPDFSTLADSQFLEAPEAKEIKIDENYDKVDVYSILSRISLTKDGGIVIGDGYGSRIIMAGGNITLQAAGDITFQSGRRIVTMAGDDAIVRAKNSIDITSSDKDVRIKAEKNLQAVSTNGGVLIESQSSGAAYTYQGVVGEEVSGAGVILKAKNSPVAMLGADVYAKCGVAGGTTGGEIVLDAQEGQSLLKMIASSVHQMVEASLTTMFGTKTVRGVNEQNEAGAYFHTNINAAGNAAFTGAVTCSTGITVTNGHITTSEANRNQGKVLQTRGNSSQSALEVLTTVFSKYKKNGQKSFDALKTKYLDGNKLGSEKLQKVMAFSFRDEEQYGTTSYKFVEPAWQTMAEAGGSTLETWTENHITYQNKKYQPFPGYKAWSEDNRFYKLAQKMFDFEKGAAKARDNEDYVDMKYGEWEEPTKASESYKVIS